MTQNVVITVIRDGVYTVLISAAPMLVIAAAVGLLVSILQATTQIHEQTLAFVPKIVAVMLSLIFFGGLIMNSLTDFATRLFESVNTYLG